MHVAETMGHTVPNREGGREGENERERRMRRGEKHVTYGERGTETRQRSAD